MTRSLKKIPLVNFSIIRKLQDKDYSIVEDLDDKFSLKLKQRLGNKIFLMLKTKNFSIYAYLIGLNFLVYNGKNFSFLSLKEQMVKHKLGEFVITKALGSDIHIDKKKKRKK
jgi:ribosomal protein S19